jgi:hypothetical protein
MEAFKTKRAVIHSKAKEKSTIYSPSFSEISDEVTIIHEKGPNDVIAEYNGVRYTAILNGFVGGYYYVDDIYGKLPDQKVCPICGDVLPEFKVE